MWRRLGRVFEPEDDLRWGVSHAALPVPLCLDGDLVRVYFSSRDAAGRSRIGYLELNVASRTVMALSPAAVIEPGLLGTFDDSGATSSCIVEHDGRLYQYYTGWSRGVTVPFYLFIGLACSDDGGLSFRKVSPGPILDRNEVDPFLTASPSVIVEDGRWRMWYISGTAWKAEVGQPKHYYHVKYAESRDGLHWHRDGRVCIDYQDPEEHAFGRPAVMQRNGKYEMWYCYRGSRYRLGHAESSDGLRWHRKDDLAGLEPPELDWDSEMVAYPYVFGHGDREYMLYNGNGYGRTGFGLAVRERAG